MSNAYTPEMMAQSMAESLLRENKSLKEAQRKDSEDMLRLIADIRYVAGIAERGRGKPLEDGEKFTQAVLDYVKSLESQLSTLKEQNALLTVQVPEGWKLVPVEILKNIYMLIDPPPIEVDGKMMVFKNPKAADTITKISAEVRALLDSTAPAALPKQVNSEDARDAARYRWLRGRANTSGLNVGFTYAILEPQDKFKILMPEKLDELIDAAISAQENKL